MRRPLSSTTLALLALTGGLIVAGLGIGAAPARAAGEKICTITDPRMTELSGMVATKSGYVVINDGTDDDSRERVFFLDTKCKLGRTPVPYSGNGPYDPEDLALSADGRTLWIADIGANVTSTNRRTSVVLWSLPVDGSAKPVLHRLTYPGGKTPDAEALLIGPDDIPLIITKSIGKAEIYRPSGPLQKNNAEGVPLTKVGEITLPRTTTPNVLGQPGRVTITGAARSPDGTRVVLRTYADAFEWDVAGGDVVKALTTGTPRATALADPFGEAITYSPDGRSFRTVSDLGDLDSATEVTILGYTPSTQAAVSAKDAQGGEKKSGQSWIDKLSLDDITYLIASVGVLGALLVGAGIFGILRARRRPGGDGPGSGGSDGEPPSGRAAPRGGPAAAGGVYGRNAPPEPGPLPGYRGRPEEDGPRRGAGRRSGGVYGGQPANGATSGAGGTTHGRGRPAGRQPGGGGVYGGGRSGGVYGGGGGGGYPDDSRYPDEGRRANGQGHGGGRSRRRGPERPGYGPDGEYDYR